MTSWQCTAASGGHFHQSSQFTLRLSHDRHAYTENSFTLAILSNTIDNAQTLYEGKTWVDWGGKEKASKAAGSFLYFSG